MTKAKNGRIVKVHYVGKLEDGTIFDSSKDRDPIQFEIGKNTVIPGFEEGIIGMEVGEKKEIVLTPEKAYGPYRKEFVTVVERKHFKDPQNLKIGQQVKVQLPDNQFAYFVITNIADDKVTLDGNHPLAGKNLIFEVELISVEEGEKSSQDKE